METYLKHRSFKHAKGEEEISHDIMTWQTHLNFMQSEIDFLKQLIKTYPFNNMMLNLFERVQLYVDGLEKFKQEKDKIKETIHLHEKELKGMPECTDLYCDNFYNEKHENIAGNIFNLEQKFKLFKTDLYNYINGNTT